MVNFCFGKIACECVCVKSEVREGAWEDGNKVASLCYSHHVIYNAIYSGALGAFGKYKTRTNMDAELF
jgi:hypothetical protein